MNIRLLLQIFSDLATKPIFEKSDWIEEPKYYSNEQNVTADLFCHKCQRVKTFSGRAYSRDDLAIQYQKDNTSRYAGFGTTPFDSDGDDEGSSVDEMISEIALPVDDVVVVQLKCPTCNDKVYICYHIEVESHLDESRLAMRIDQIRVTKIGEYPNQETSRLQEISKYILDFADEYEYLAKAERAFYSGLGAGAIAYLRKAYEILLYAILDEHGSSRPKQFRQALEKADEVERIVPATLKDRAYGLFGEMSDIVHGETDDSVGLEKYELLRDVFTMILDNILEKRKQAVLAQKIKLDSDPKRGGTTK